MTLFGNNLCKCDQVVFILMRECPCKREIFDTDTQGRWHVKRQTETGVMCLQAKGPKDSSNHPEVIFVSEDMKRSDPSYIAAWNVNRLSL